MKTKIPDFLKKVYGTDDPTAIVKQKQNPSLRHERAVMSGKKPETVPLTQAECKKLCTLAGIEYKDGYEFRVLEYTITTEDVDRYGDIVRADGLDVNNYKKNPVINHAHNNTFPVGNTIKIWKDKDWQGGKAWKAWGLFMDDTVDKTGIADATFQMAKAGFMPGCSIGFVSKETNYPKPEERAEMGMPPHGVEYKSAELLEWSTCSVQANPNALQTNHEEPEPLEQPDTKMMTELIQTKSFTDKHLDAITKNKLVEEPVIKSLASLMIVCTTEEIAEILKPYPNEHACRLQQPDKFDKFRRGTRKHDGKTYSIIFGHDKDKDAWEEQAYRYAKDSWTSEDASAHCKSHNGAFTAASDKAMDNLTSEDSALVDKILKTIELQIATCLRVSQEDQTKIRASMDTLLLAVNEFDEVKKAIKETMEKYYNLTREAITAFQKSPAISSDDLKKEELQAKKVLTLAQSIVETLNKTK